MLDWIYSYKYFIFVTRMMNNNSAPSETVNCPCGKLICWLLLKE